MKTFEKDLESLAKFQYTSTSHMFNRAVIASYNNVIRYGCNLGEDIIHIPQMKKDLIFYFGKGCPPNRIHMFHKHNSNSLLGTKPELWLNDDRVQTVYSEISNTTRKEIKEVTYNLIDICSEQNLTTEMKRGIKFTTRPEVKIIDNDGKYNDEIYNSWVEAKRSDPKVYQIAFNPNRYRRSFNLRDYGYRVYERLIVIKDTPYGLINFSLDYPQAYELSFPSKYNDKNLKLTNDQNNCIIANCLYDLYQNHAISRVNLGTAAGIKGLSFFKKRFEYGEQIVYSS